MDDSIEAARRFDLTMELSSETGRLLTGHAELSTDTLYDEHGFPK